MARPPVSPVQPRSPCSLWPRPGGSAGRAFWKVLGWCRAAPPTEPLRSSLFTVLPRAVLPGPLPRPGHIRVAGWLQLHGHALPQRLGGLRHHVPEGEALPGEGMALVFRPPDSSTGAPGEDFCLTRSSFLGLSEYNSVVIRHSCKMREKKMKTTGEKNESWSLFCSPEQGRASSTLCTLRLNSRLTEDIHLFTHKLAQSTLTVLRLALFPGEDSWFCK